MLAIFSCASMSTLRKSLFRSSAYFLIGLFAALILSCMNYLYSLEINFLSVTLIANVYVCVQSLSHVWQFVIPWAVACQDLHSLGFSQQEYWSESPFPAPGGSPNPGTWIWVSSVSWIAGKFFTGWAIGQALVCKYFLLPHRLPFALFRGYCVLSHLVLLDFCNPKGYSLLGSSVQVISQARILEWIIISFSRG